MTIRPLLSSCLLAMICLGAAILLGAGPAAGQDSGGQAGLRMAEFARDNQLPLMPSIGNRLTVVHENKARPSGGGVNTGGSDYYVSQWRTASQTNSIHSDTANAFIISKPTIEPCLPEENIDRMWIGGVGAWSKQKDTAEDFGYKYTAYGLVGGYEWERGDLTVGIAGGYTKGKLKGNDGISKNDVDTMQIGAYASYDPVSGVFADARVGIGRSNNKLSGLEDGIPISGSFHHNSISAGLNMGYTVQRGDLRITPTLGVQWTHLNQGSWLEETASPGALGNWYDSASNDYIEFPLAVRVNRAFQMSNGMVVTPEARAAYIFNAGDNAATVRTGPIGDDAGSVLFGVNPGNSRGLVGAGVKVNLNSKFDAYVDYNYEFRSNFSNNNLTTGMGVSF